MKDRFYYSTLILQTTMKAFFFCCSLFALFLFGLAVSTVLAQDQATQPVVMVTSPTEARVNGIPRGKPCDAVANEPTLAPAMQAALESWAAQVQSERDAAVQALQAKEARINTVLETLLKREKKNAPNGATVQLLEELKVEAAKPAEQAKREALQAEIEAKQAELNKLLNPPTE